MHPDRLTPAQADDKLVAVFASEDDCRVWVHKMTREVFDGDGDGLLWTKNIEWDEPTIPVTLARVVDCVLERAAVADGSGGLVLAPGAADDVKPREYRVGEEARSAWLARSVARLRGAVRYRTADPNSLEDEDAEATGWDEIDVTNDKLARLMRERGAEAE